MTQQSYSYFAPKRAATKSESAFWNGVLIVLTFSLVLGPRIRLGGLSGKSLDLRVQDLLLIPCSLFVLLSRSQYRVKQIFHIFRIRTLLIFFSLTAVTLATSYSDASISPFLRFAVEFRMLEFFALVWLLASVTTILGHKAINIFFKTLLFSLILNLLWWSYQMATGSFQTLLGTADVSTSSSSYGPKLIGEPSAFGSGNYWAFSVALGICLIHSRLINKIMGIVIVALTFYALYTTQSRINIWSALVLITSVFWLRTKRRATLSLFGLLFVIEGMALAWVYLIPNLSGRLSTTGAEIGIQVRAFEIWVRVWDFVLAQPFLGLGPGVIGTSGLTEAHNMYLRLIGDWGIPAGLLLLYSVLRIGKLALVKVRQFNLTAADMSPYALYLLAFMQLVSVLISGVFQDSFTAVMSSHILAYTFGISIGVIANEKQLSQREVEKS